jgi:hypothetical protein
MMKRPTKAGKDMKEAPKKGGKMPMMPSHKTGKKC